MSYSISARDTIAVIGTGAMGAGIAQVAAASGHPVLLYDTRGGAAEAAITGIRSTLDKLVEKGKWQADDANATVARLKPVKALTEVKGAKLVIEAVIEDANIKRELFAQLEEIVAADAVLATNTSSFSITSLAAKLKRPERLCGMHFFNPAPLMPLVEVISGLATSSAVLDEIFELCQRWKKEPVRVRSTPGFIVNRVARPFYGEALRILQEGAADPATIDAIMRDCGGFRMGPFELMDLIGNDVNFAVTRSIHAAYFGDPRFTPSLLQQELVEAGWFGKKTKRGWYDYSAAMPVPLDAPAGLAPKRVGVYGDLGPAKWLAEALDAANIPVERKKASAGHLEVDGVKLALTDGRPATTRAMEFETAEFAVFDLCRDYSASPRVACAVGQQAKPQTAAQVAGFFQAIGKKVSLLGDVPGLVVMRTVAMLANEASDAVLHRVASPADVDLAMKKGTNYPLGPLEWADAIGSFRLLSALEGLSFTYGEDRYRASAYLRQRAEAAIPLRA